MVASVTLAVIGLLTAFMITRYRNSRESERGRAALRRSGRSHPLLILMPVYGRPRYLREVLAALSRVRDIDRTLLIVSQDGNNAEVSALIAGVRFTEVIHLRHTRPFGGITTFFWDSLYAASTNIHFLLDFAFGATEAKGAIILEDDIVPSPDFVNYFEWAFAHILSDPRVLSVTGFNLHSRVWPEKGYHPGNHPYDMIHNRENGREKFTGWSWGITRENWQRIRRRWSFTSWDLGLDALQRKMGLISYKPVLGRARNIGMQQGINFTEFEGNPKWKGIHIAGAPIDYSKRPRLLEEEAVIPPYENIEPPRPGRNERERTWTHRLWLYAFIAVMTLIELRLFLKGQPDLKASTLLIPLAVFAGLLLYKRTSTLHERLFPERYASEHFPERHFPARNPPAFRERVAAGYRTMKESSAVLCGITKDDADILPLTIRRIEQTGGLFRDYRVVVYENDSRDPTPAILKAWESANRKVRVLSDPLVGAPILRLPRTERLAWCRNRYLDFIRQEDEYRACDYVIVVDLDLKGGWSYDGLASSFSRRDWDIVASNSIAYHYLRKTYYDLYALKPRTVLKRNWLFRLIGEGWQLRRDDPWIPIQSGFGGLAVYRKEKLIPERYAGTLNGEAVCEHIALNADHRLRCYLNPAQITVTGTQEPKGYPLLSPWKKALYKLFCNW